MKVFVHITALLLISALLLAGCQNMPKEKPPIHLVPDMDNQAKYKPLSENDQFANKSAMRMPPEGTVVRGQYDKSLQFRTGKNEDGSFVKKSPIAYTWKSLERGQERYNIYCSRCHDYSGHGNGIVVQRGFKQAASHDTERLRTIEDGYIFTVMSEGFKNMPSLAHQIPVEDRWHIINYMRALQLSQNATIDDIPEKIRKNLK